MCRAVEINGVSRCEKIGDEGGEESRVRGERGLRTIGMIGGR